MTDTPLISIALATYNGETYLPQQLDSLFAQDYPNLEIVVSDDNSKDRTYDILESYAAHAPFPMHVIRNTGPRGFVMNFANAISQCKGDYISLCDQDDIWYPQKTRVLFEHQQATKALLVYSNARIIDANGHQLAESWYNGQSKDNNPTSGHIPEAFYLFSFVTGCMALLSSDVIRHFKINENVYYHDWFLSWGAARLGDIAYLDTHLMDYRRHPHSITTGKGKRSWIPSNIDFIKIIDDHQKRQRQTGKLLKQLIYIQEIESGLGIDQTQAEIVKNYLEAIQFKLSAKREAQTLLQHPELLAGKKPGKEKKLFRTHKQRLVKNIAGAVVLLTGYLAVAGTSLALLFQLAL